jgi:HNH endonuclease
MAGDPRPKQPRGKKKRTSDAEFSPTVRLLVERRSLGMCEVQETGCWGKATMLHHIRRRSQGGKGTVENALAVCAHCHTWIHEHVAISEERGHLVRSGPLDS